MADHYIGEILAVAFDYAPRGWAMCNGQLLSISQNQALFSLLGTQFGGNGQTNFALPDLRGRCAVGAGNGSGLSSRTIGEQTGQETHTLTTFEMPSHSHSLLASGASATTNNPQDGVPNTPNVNPRMQTLYGNVGDQTAGSGTISTTGGSQPHENRQPFTAVNFCIALVGSFPPRD